MALLTHANELLFIAHESNASKVLFKVVSCKLYCYRFTHGHILCKKCQYYILIVGMKTATSHIHIGADKSGRDNISVMFILNCQLIKNAVVHYMIQKSTNTKKNASAESLNNRKK